VKNEQQTLDGVDVRAAAVLLKQVCACDLLDNLEPCSADVLVIHGQYDPYVSRPVSERLAEKLNGQFYEFQGTHHAPMVEKPQHFYRVIKDFLDKAQQL
jgi:pimeloyl-ACP methyl ester carboxylesterase